MTSRIVSVSDEVQMPVEATKVVGSCWYVMLPSTIREDMAVFPRPVFPRSIML